VNRTLSLGLTVNRWRAVPRANRRSSHRTILSAATPHGAYWFPFFLAFTLAMTAMRVLIAFVYTRRVAGATDARELDQRAGSV
jgi:hypothetical protein